MEKERINTPVMLITAYEIGAGHWMGSGHLYTRSSAICVSIDGTSPEDIVEKAHEILRTVLKYACVREELDAGPLKGKLFSWSGGPVWFAGTAFGEDVLVKGTGFSDILDQILENGKETDAAAEGIESALGALSYLEDSLNKDSSQWADFKTLGEVAGMIIDMSRILIIGRGDVSYATAKEMVAD